MKVLNAWPLMLVSLLLILGTLSFPLMITTSVKEQAEIKQIRRAHQIQGRVLNEPDFFRALP